MKKHDNSDVHQADDQNGAGSYLNSRHIFGVKFHFSGTPPTSPSICSAPRSCRPVGATSGSCWFLRRACHFSTWVLLLKLNHLSNGSFSIFLSLVRSEGGRICLNSSNWFGLALQYVQSFGKTSCFNLFSKTSAT